MESNAERSHGKDPASPQQAEDLKAGRWQFAGDPIRFDKHGRLIDGQHRLQACIMAGTPFEAIIVEGLPPDAQTICDAGVKRKGSDVLQGAGVTHAAAVAAAARWLLDIKHNGRFRGRFSNPHLLEIVSKHPKLEDSATRIYRGGTSLQRFVLGPKPTLAIAMYYVGAYLLKEQEKADAFISVFETGKPSYKGDPAQVWRERLVRLRAGSARLSRDVELRGMIHAWNLFASRKTVEKFIPPNEAAIEGLDLKKI